jgi:hypothetical protein
MTAFPRHTRWGRLTSGGRLLVPAGIVVLLAAAACGGSATDDRASTRDEPEPLLMEVDDAYAQADMATLSEASDTVVRGTVTAAEPGLRLGSRQNPLRYTRFTVAVDEVLGGTAGDEVQVLLSTHVNRRPVTMEGRPTPEVGDEAVWFLTPTRSEARIEGYVLTGQSGLLLLDGDEVNGGGTHDARIHTQVEDLGSADAVVDHVRAVSD